MNRKEVCKSLIKIANRLDKSGYYNEANQITSVANNLNKLAASFLGDLGGNLLGEISSELNKKNPTIFDPATGQYKTNPDNSALQSGSVEAKKSLLDQQAKLFESMKKDAAGPGIDFYKKYPMLNGLNTIDQIYRKAYDLAKFSKDQKTKFTYDALLRFIYTKYYQEDVRLRYQLRQLGA